MATIYVEYFFEGKPAPYTKVESVALAEKWIRFLAARGMTGWALDADRNFLPVKGAKRDPRR